ncbi:hypothetical protein DQ04_05461010 [Trypanosoma grayi]|uniref:hypothetical protein n=1 Tax=Trypanosoma grayi TaxID=71804 RepID=UPI0004F4AE38|nr:hypothetical protein DQ04_05461010 [Trypanosoma grayi]KEG09296.1 hypothetical protein DQ04_05461010 [Trypanosoma grayi]
MSAADDGIADFWAWCTQSGVVSKKLSVRRGVHEAVPQLSLHMGEAVRAGAVVVSVPYLATLNAQTIRGGMRPAAVPSFRATCAFLTRRQRMDVATANSLWLASCLACYRRLLAQGHAMSIAPLLSPALMPALPSPFVAAHAGFYPAIAAALPSGQDDAVVASFLSTLGAQAEAQLQLTHAALQFYQHRRMSRVSPRLVPTLDELRMAHRAVLQRGVLLPFDCVPSSPGDLADLFEERPDLDLLPTFVPLIDIIRSPTALQTPKGEKVGDNTAANCTLHTCTQANFISLGSRRRVVVETAPLSSRRIVVCAASDLKEGEELLLDYGPG